ncbi:MAG: FecR domain-containing protein [Deltaproteobacteria bacterium]|nr:FecR domain-containing protein [Deltaproteobacteria bacterium]
MSAPNDRGRLGPLADRVDGLDEKAQARVLAAVRAEGPKIVRRARIQRVVTRVGAVAAALTLAVWMAQRPSDLAPQREDPIAAAPNTPRSTPNATPSAPGPQLAVAPRACEAWSPASQGFVREGGVQVLDLGRRGRVVATKGSLVELEVRSSCETLVSVRFGSVFVRADDLGSGALVVASKEGQVRVLGTVFSVESGRGRWVIEVAEGKVEVEPISTEPTTVAAGQRFELTPKGSQRSTLSAKRLAELVHHAAAEARVAHLEPEKETRTAPEAAARAKPKPDPAVEPGGPSVAPLNEPREPKRAVVPRTPLELLREAETLRKDGELDAARRIYREVASGSGETAEAALLRLAGLELEKDEPVRAKALALELRRRFPSGRLAVEATWIAVRAATKDGAMRDAKQLAEELVARWPSTPYADSARVWLREHPASP